MEENETLLSIPYDEIRIVENTPCLGRGSFGSGITVRE